MIILVAEDEPFTAMDLMTALNADGHRVIGPAATVAEALDLAGATAPDVALLDINLPDGNGIDAARELFRRHGCRSLFISGSVHEGLLAGEAAIGFLSKPFETDAVLRSIEIVQAAVEGRPYRKLPPQLELYPTVVELGARPVA